MSVASKYKFKDTGVKKCFIIGLVPEVAENYINVKTLWSSTGVHNLQRRFTIASDLKLCNILLGLMSHASLHPCCWCDIDKNHLSERGNDRTLGNLKHLYTGFQTAGVDARDAKHYGNVIHLPIVSGHDRTSILDVIPPPELHLMTGPVYAMYSSMKKLWPECEEWLNRCHVQADVIHGGSFTGNTSRKLLKNVGILRDMKYPRKCASFIDAFQSFNDVVESCYGADLHPEYEKKIMEFKTNYLKLGINISPKIHAVFYHVPDFCKRTNQSLGPFSEQASESIHHDFNITWTNYQTGPGNPNYGVKLLEAVRMYNSQHI